MKPNEFSRTSGDNAWNRVVRSGMNQASILKEINKRLMVMDDQEVNLFI